MTFGNHDKLYESLLIQRQIMLVQPIKAITLFFIFNACSVNKSCHYLFTSNFITFNVTKNLPKSLDQFVLVNAEVEV
jgi:hypothetical protein